jgi:hypothetical protein
MLTWYSNTPALDVKWKVSFKRMQTNISPDVAFNGTAYPITITTYAGLQQTYLTISKDEIIPGYYYFMEICRLGSDAADTLTDSIRLVNVTVSQA